MMLYYNMAHPPLQHATTSYLETNIGDLENQCFCGSYILEYNTQRGPWAIV